MAGQRSIQLLTGFRSPLLADQVADQPHRSGLIVGLGRQQFPVKPIGSVVIVAVAERPSQLQLGGPIRRVLAQDLPEQPDGAVVLVIVKVGAAQFNAQPVVIGETLQGILQQVNRRSGVLLPQGRLGCRQALFGGKVGLRERGSGPRREGDCGQHQCHSEWER